MWLCTFHFGVVGNDIWTQHKSYITQQWGTLHGHNGAQSKYLLFYFKGEDISRQCTLGGGLCWFLHQRETLKLEMAVQSAKYKNW
jgi:hypothetical protein